MRERITYFAKSDYRGGGKPFGIKSSDRSRHLYVIGKTGMGKTTLLQNMAVQDIQNGEGIGFIDPHGAAVDELLDFIPEERVKDVIYFAPFDMENPISFNIMEDVGYDKRHLVVSGLVSTFKKIWPDVWSSRMEYILSNTLFALLEYPDSTLLGVNRMLVDKEFRKKVVDNVTDPVVKSFWVDEFAKYTDRYTQEATPAIQNKIGQFVSNPLIRNIIGQPKSSFDFRGAMDSKKILLMNLSKGRMGDTNTQLIGSMLVIKTYLAAMSRADLPNIELAKLPYFYFYVDEFQSFANETFADILSESRKYKLSLTIAHQYIEQMPEEVRSAVFGNVGTMMAFRVGSFDADILEKEFAPSIFAQDIVNLGFAQVYLKLMIDGLTSKPFSAETLPPIKCPEKSLRDEAIEYSRKAYARARREVEEAIQNWAKPIEPPPRKTDTRRTAQPSQSARFGQPTSRAPHAPRDIPSERARPVPPRHTSPREAPEDARARETPRGVRERPAGEALPHTQPLKKAFKEIERAPRAAVPRQETAVSHEKRGVGKEPLSLKMLQKNTKKPQKDPKRMNELRDALTKAMEEEKKEEKTVPPKKTESETAEKKAQTPLPREIPEEKLRSILRID